MATATDRLFGLLGRVSAEAAELAGRVRPGVVVVRGPRGGQGSGIVWRADGLVLTNDHVVPGDRAEVLLADGQRLAATVLRRDRAADLAALRVPARGLPAVPVADPRGLRPGELVIAVGNPLGTPGAVAVGILSGVVPADGPVGRRRPELVRADVDLYPGNSGGPLLDARGRVIGINSQVAGPGIALAVPSHLAQRFAEGDERAPAFLGVIVQQVPVPAARAFLADGRPGRGLLISAVAEGSPAERAGLLLGDVLLAVGEEPVGDPAELGRQLAAVGAGRPVRLTLLRGGRPIEALAVPQMTPA